jgi:hypothetical protein
VENFTHIEKSFPRFLRNIVPVLFEYPFSNLYKKGKMLINSGLLKTGTVFADIKHHNSKTNE